MPYLNLFKISFEHKGLTPELNYYEVCNTSTLLDKHLTFDIDKGINI